MANIGGQPGNENARKGFEFTNHLRAVLAEKPSGPTLRKVALKAAEAACDGEPWAIQFVADRLDGKPKQQIEHSQDPENPVFSAASLIGAVTEHLRAKGRETASAPGSVGEV